LQEVCNISNVAGWPYYDFARKALAKSLANFSLVKFPTASWNWKIIFLRQRRRQKKKHHQIVRKWHEEIIGEWWEKTKLTRMQWEAFRLRKNAGFSLVAFEVCLTETCFSVTRSLRWSHKIRVMQCYFCRYLYCTCMVFEKSVSTI
jgi:hypothetical protein